MKNDRKIALAAAVSILLYSLSGCGMDRFGDAGRGEYAVAVSMESTPIVDYTVPKLTPNILVDHSGYPAVGEKEAAVKGRELPQEFRLVDCETGEVVYSGQIQEASYDSELGIYTGFVDFEEYDGEGNYYLECDYIGRSYSFTIQSALYQQLFLELYGTMTESCEDNTASIEDAMALLITYEWYGDIFPDEDSNGIPDVLEVLAEWISHIDYGRIDEQQGALYAAFLAKFSYLYQKCDLQYATESLQRASTIFTQTQSTIQKDAENFWALTELYRAAGLYTYRSQILDYKTYFQNNSSFLEEPGYLYGAMTYMMTRQKVDVELCNLFMNHLMENGEEIARRCEDMLHPVNARNNGVNDLLKQAQELSCANYVFENYQYNCLMEDFLHYLMGRNLQSVCFYPDEGSRTGYLLLLAQLTSIEAQQ